MSAKSLAILVLLVGACYCAPQADNRINIEDLIGDVFGNGNGNPSPIPGTPAVISPVPTPIQAQPQPQPTTPFDQEHPYVGKGCGVGSQCVAYYLCNNSTINRDGAGLIDIRIDADEPQPSCPFLEECCSIDSKVTEPIIVTPPPAPSGCGYRNVDGIGFKITGDKNQETQYGEFPWMVAVLKEERVLNQILNVYQCGGSLIHPSVVLTAAHCVQNKSPQEIKVRAGEWDTQTKSELFPDQDREVVDIVVHKDFYKGGLFNDIALLFLNSPFEIAENVKTVCLPPANSQFDHSRCYATGWGKDTFGQQGQYQVILKKIDLPVVPRDTCQNTLRTTRLGKFFELHQSFICAGGEPGKDTCKGDGGSPLVCPIAGQHERYYQAGIVAWGIGCGDAIPGVYVNIPQLRPWIDEQLQFKRIDSSFYTA